MIYRIFLILFCLLYTLNGFSQSVNNPSASTYPQSTSNQNISGFRMAKNFGFENAIEAVLRKSDADVSIVMASDLQDHPKYLEILLAQFELGGEHVFQIVEKRPGVGPIRRFNKILKR